MEVSHDEGVHRAGLHDYFGDGLDFRRSGPGSHNLVLTVFRSFQPDLYLGEIPSAPDSTTDVHRAVFTQTHDIVATFNIPSALREACPKAGLFTLGTMREDGTPIDRSDGFLTIDFRGPMDTLPFPPRAVSEYCRRALYDSHDVAMGWRPTPSSWRTR